LKTYDLKKVHGIQLEMTLEVKRICEKYEISYFIIAGTLLGAVRHKGFIPWDDDLDIGMLRNDFEKFLKVCESDLSKEYFLQTMETDRNFGLPIAKLRKQGTQFVEKSSQSVNMHNGIYIDIFPFDNISKSIIRKKIQALNTYVLKRILLTKVGYKLWSNNGSLKKVIYTFIKVLSMLIPLSKQKRLLCNQIQKYNNRETKEVVAFGGAYGYRKETIQRKWVTNLTTIKFEGEDLSCSLYYQDYLTYFYGDYLTPPPEKQRYNRHEIVEVDYGDHDK
jgi:lipopolysaccharide cholinephosphotransferase